MATTTGTGAKKIDNTDDWRDIFDIHNDTVDAYDGKIGTTALPTTAQTITGAIDEHESDISALNSKIKAIENGVDNVSSSGSTIQFTGTHSSAPNVVATGADASGNPRFPVITGRTSTGFSVKVLDASGSSVGGYINWLAIW